MNGLFISYGIYDFDGRLRQLMEICEKIGKMTYITNGISRDDERKKHHYLFLKNGFFDYFRFIIFVISIALKMKNIDILFVDNRKAVIPALIIKYLKKPKYVIQDVRELYLINEVKHLSGKIGCFFEKILIQRANLLICANKYRADIMKKYYNLINKPLVYENLRKLEYTDDLYKYELSSKYKKYFHKKTIKLISTSGCSIDRTNDKLVSIMPNLGDEYELFLVGGGTKKDIDFITNIIKKNNLNNIHLIEKLNINELKYFLENCDIGIVNYSKKDLNNIYCSSGKIYEYLFEGLPVVTTENIPLIEMCEKYNIGISDDSYLYGVIEISKNLKYYTENVEKYVSNISVDRNDNELVNDIKNFFGGH